MLPSEQNYETHDIELLAMVEAFKTWCHYLKGAKYTIFVFINPNNLKKSMEVACPSGRQITWVQELLRYDFKINYRPEIKNPADVLSRPITDKDAEKWFVKRKRKYWTSCNTLHHRIISPRSMLTIKQLQNQWRVMKKTLFWSIIHKC